MSKYIIESPALEKRCGDSDVLSDMNALSSKLRNTHGIFSDTFSMISKSCSVQFLKIVTWYGSTILISGIMEPTHFLRSIERILLGYKIMKIYKCAEYHHPKRCSLLNGIWVYIVLKLIRYFVWRIFEQNWILIACWINTSTCIEKMSI